MLLAPAFLGWNQSALGRGRGGTSLLGPQHTIQCSGKEVRESLMLEVCKHKPYSVCLRAACWVDPSAIKQSDHPRVHARMVPRFLQRDLVGSQFSLPGESLQAEDPSVLYTHFSNS